MKPSAIDQAKHIEPAVKITPGASWAWASFYYQKDAEKFVKWCNENGWENRGISEPFGNWKTWDVRFR